MTKQERDWNKDMELFTGNDKWDWTSDRELQLEAAEALPFWLQQYAAEKERADKLQAELSEYTEAHWKAFEREKKLREAIEKAISQSWSGDMSALLDIKNELKASLYPKEEEAK